MDKERIRSFEPKATLLVTGATGRLGSALCRHLVAQGCAVRALVRDRRAAAEVLPDAVELAGGDIGDRRAVEASASDCQVVFIAMGVPEQWLEDPERFGKVNADGTAVLTRAAAAADVRRLVHVSTVDVFEAVAGSRFDEDLVAHVPRRSPHQRSKQLAERAALEAGGHLQVVIANLAGLLGGRRRRPSLEDDLIRPLVVGRLPVQPPGSLNLISVDSVSEGLLLAGPFGRPGPRYLFSDRHLQVRELARIALEATGRLRVPPTLDRRPPRAAVRVAEWASGWTGHPPFLAAGQVDVLLRNAEADTTRARRELGWMPHSLTTTIEALARELAPGGAR